MFSGINNYTTSEMLELELKEYINNKYGEPMLYKGVIKKVHPVQPTRNGKFYFRRIEFVLDNGDWCKTDIVQGFRNSKRWQIGMDYGVGTKVTNLKLKDSTTIDADSDVRFIK